MNQAKDDASESKDIGVNIGGLIGLLAGVVTVWIAAWLVIIQMLPDWNNRGLFGDMFGSVNSLFAGLAFAGVIYTILLQRNELALQRRELELTREQLTRSAKAQELSEEALREQGTTLQLTAKLNALSALIDHYDILIKNEGNASKKIGLQQERVRYIKILKALLDTFAPETAEELF